MNILMTGATGFLGHHLLRRLVADGNRVHILKRSFSDTGRIREILESSSRLVSTYDLDRGSLEGAFENAGGGKFDIVLHCATHYGRKEVDPIAIIEANLILPLKLLKLAVDRGVGAFINTDTVLDKRISSYSLSKRQFAEWMQTYSAQITCMNVALEHFYGPGDDRSKFVSAIIHDLLKDVPELKLTPGEQKRDFIHIDDVVEAFMAIIQDAPARPQGMFGFQVGSDRVIRIRDFVELVKKLTGNQTTNLKFGALPYRENEVMESHVDITELKRLGWNAKVDLESGMRRTIEIEKSKLG